MTILLVDMDEVLTQWAAHFVSLMVRTYGRFSPYQSVDDLVSWDLHAGLNLSERSCVTSVMNHPSFYRDLVPHEGATLAINRLSEHFDVFFCSTPWDGNPDSMGHKRDWLEKYMGLGWGKRLILTHDKTLVRGDILIDDKPEIKGVLAGSQEWRQIIFDAPYNRHVDGPRLSGWHDWKEVLTWADSWGLADASVQARTLEPTGS